MKMGGNPGNRNIKQIFMTDNKNPYEKIKDKHRMQMFVLLGPADRNASSLNLTKIQVYRVKSCTQ